MNLMLTRSETLIDHISLLTNNVRMVLKNESLGIAVTQEVTRKPFMLDNSNLDLSALLTYVCYRRVQK